MQVDFMRYHLPAAAVKWKFSEGTLTEEKKETLAVRSMESLKGEKPLTTVQQISQLNESPSCKVTV